jgi:battenin
MAPAALPASPETYQRVATEADIAGDENDILTPPTVSSSRYLHACFWFLGLLNNASYVIMIACAKNISEGGTAMVFLANVGPSLLVKLSAPYWFDHVSYQRRMLFGTLAMISSFSLVASNSSESYSGKFTLAWSLLGVALGSVQTGLGEASLLALAGKCDGKTTSTSSKAQCLTCFSSGTGMAGVFGFFWKWLWTDFLGFSVSTMLWLAMVLPAGYWATFRRVMVEEANLSPVSTTNSSTDEDVSIPEYQELTLDPMAVASSSEETQLAIPVPKMSGYQRFCRVLQLWPYIVPLFTVYAAEYALQSGTWTAIGFPVDDVASRDRFYEFSNWMYQAGVFVSRSSGTLWTAPLWILWVMPGLQSVNVVIFYNVASHAETSVLYSPGILYCGAFYAGLLGGSCYINAYKRICKDLPPLHQEFALSSTSVGESLGIVVADILGLFIQSCLYQINGLDGTLVECPLG